MLLACGLAACGGPAKEAATDPVLKTTPSRAAGSALGFPTSAPLVGPEPGSHTTISLASGRKFILSVPADYDPAQEWPLVLSFHGWGETAGHMFSFTNLDYAEAIVAFPQGTDNAWAPAPYAKTTGEEDLSFVAEVVDSLRATYSIDDSRIHAMGLSNGGGFAMYLSCQMPGVFASTATVSAAYYDSILQGCSNTPTGHLDIHGTDDPVINYNGGTRHKTHYRSVEDVMFFETKRNGCLNQLDTTLLSNSSARQEWRGCTQPLVHIRIGGGQHVWPGGSNDSENGLPAGFATDAVLDFFGIPGRVPGQEDSANKNSADSGQ